MQRRDADEPRRLAVDGGLLRGDALGERLAVAVDRELHRRPVGVVDDRPQLIGLGDGLSVGGTDDVVGFEHACRRRVVGQGVDADHRLDVVAEFRQRRGGRLLLGVDHHDGALLVALLGALSLREHLIDRDDRLRRIEPRQGQLEPRRRPVAVADDLHGQQVERAGGGEGLRAGHRDQRHLVAGGVGGGAERVEDGTGALDDERRRDEGERQQGHERDRERPDADERRAAHGRATRGHDRRVLVEQCHVRPFRPIVRDRRTRDILRGGPRRPCGEVLRLA